MSSTASGSTDLTGPALPRSVVWRRSQHALWRTVLEDVIAADSRGDGPPFALAGGAGMWRLLEDSITTEDLAKALGADTGDSDRLRMLDVLEEMHRRGVVERFEA